MLTVIVPLQLLALRAAHRLRARLGDERGQSTAEYALVLLGAAAVAALFIGWATTTGRVGQLLNAVLDRVLGQVRA